MRYSPALLLLTVAAGCNSPPDGTIVAPEGHVVISRGQTVDFEGTGEDPDDGVEGLSYRWTFDQARSGVPDADVQSPGSVQFCTESHPAAPFDVTLTVTDRQGLADPTPATRTIEVGRKAWWRPWRQAQGSTLGYKIAGDRLTGEKYRLDCKYNRDSTSSDFEHRTPNIRVCSHETCREGTVLGYCGDEIEFNSKDRYFQAGYTQGIVGGNQWIAMKHFSGENEKELWWWSTDAAKREEYCIHEITCSAPGCDHRLRFHDCPAEDPDACP